LESRCPSCDSPADESAAFCPHCGKPTGFVEPLGLPLAATQGPRLKGLGTASWEEMKQVLVFYAILLGCSLFFGLLEWAHPGPQAEIYDAAVFILIVMAYLVRNWRDVSRVFRFRKPKSKRLAELAVVCAVVYFFLQGYFWAVEHLGVPMMNYTEDYTKAHWPLWGMLALVSLEPGVFEEIAFRGILQTKLSHILSVREALIIQAALFSILHLSPGIFVSHFVMGLLLGWVRLRTGHLYFGMLLHMAWNAMVILKELGY